MSERRPRAKRAFWPPFTKRDDNGGSDRAIARSNKTKGGLGRAGSALASLAPSDACDASASTA